MKIQKSHPSGCPSIKFPYLGLSGHNASNQRSKSHDVIAIDNYIAIAIVASSPGSQKKWEEEERNESLVSIVFRERTNFTEAQETP